MKNIEVSGKDVGTYLEQQLKDEKARKRSTTWRIESVSLD